MIHAVKITPKYFPDVISGKKTFEIRANDRDYRVGDFLALNVYAPKANAPEQDCYTGQSALFEITYIFNDPSYCKSGYIILGTKPVDYVTVGRTGSEAAVLVNDSRFKGQNTDKEVNK